MGQSYRIRTELGINKTINIQLDQEFEFLEILSLKLQQEDVYVKSCAEYGVVVGRVTANNGFGLPNARVSVFIPIDSVDESNPIISSIYPYKSPNDRNEDGYRYNLLPYEQSYSTHAATGTLPSRLDSLTGSTAIEIYDKYYKFSVKTNESGDYMIMGVPQGQQTLVMDVDLSDIGEFSLTPQDLIRMGLATDAQVAGNRFKTSTDLNSLPQIVNIVKSLEVSPLWGDPELCSIAINRLDFDLRDNANINIEPTSIFMGSIYSTADSFRVRPPVKVLGFEIGGNRPKDNMGNLCSLSTGPGQILAIRQTVYQDSDGNPTLEQYQLEQAGNIIDGNGTWLTELPMNLDYYITNEFGDKVISNDPTIGIPTKAKYRFKIKWQQPQSLSEQVRRPYYLVPNIKEYGWENVTQDPSPTSYTIVGDAQKKQQSSYYFGLAWSGYTDGFTNPTQKLNRLNEIIDCDDTFYEFQFNRVYTVSGLIDEFKNGGRGRFIGIKEIDSQDCDSTVNKFPVNDGFRNFDLLYFIFAILFQILQVFGIPLLLVYHIAGFIWTYVVPTLLGALIALLLVLTYQDALSAFVSAPAWGLVVPFALKAAAELLAATLLGVILSKIVGTRIPTISLPMITYPDCQACECNNSNQASGGGDAPVPSPGLLSQLSNPINYYNSIYEDYLASGESEDNAQLNGLMISQSIGGTSSSPRNPQIFKSTQSGKFNINTRNFYTLGITLPPGERINVYNTRKKFFDGVNKIKTTFNYPSNGSRHHFDNTLTVLATQDVEVGTLLSFVNPSKSTDKNYLWSGLTKVGGVQVNGINGIIKNNAFTATVKYATSQISDTVTTYDIPSGNSQCFLSVTFDIDSVGSIVFSDCSGVKHYSAATTTGLYTISSEYGVDISTITGVATWTGITYGQATQRYIYPSDIEYYQVLTAITITSNVVAGKTYYTIPNLGPNTTSFWSALTADNNFYLFQEKKVDAGNWYFSYGGGISESPPASPSTYPTSYFADFVEQKILILQRGVDPYSPLLPNRYGIGKILGHSSEDAVVITGMTRMNIPIQKLSGSTTSVQQHNSQDNIYSSSYFYTPGIPSSPLFPTASSTPGLAFSSYTTSNVGYYGALDSKFNTPPYYIVKSNGKTYGGLASTTTVHGDLVSFMPNTASISGVIGVNAKFQNKFYSVTLNPQNYYDNSEDLSGGAYMFGNMFNNRSPYGRLPVQKRSDGYFLEPDTPFNLYYSPILYPYMTGTTQLNITGSSKNIMRTDRLPSSDFIDNDGNLNGSVSLLQQNLGFAVYSVDGTLASNSPSFSTGAQQPTADVAGQLASENVLTTLNTCENMVGLTCYSGNGTNFGVELGCNSNDSVESGCYVFVRRILIDLFKDWKSFAEWGYRFRFFYGLCRGVLSQSFVNNWVNGSLYTFPIQVNSFFNTNNEPNYPEFPRPIVYYNSDSNNFYYRSSPYLLTTSSATTKFIGSPTSDLISSVNKRNLLFPTTIINLGIKDEFYQEIIFDASAKGYIMKSLQSTSYSDTSDLVNLFVISRISDSSFLKQVLSGLNASLNKLFSRPQLRIDGDLAQSMSINSEYGVIPFSPEFYAVNGASDDPVVIITSSSSSSPSGPTMGIFFSSTTVDLQNKDFLTPGIIDFRPSNNVNAITYEYGIKSQTTPFYQWGLRQPSTQSIFGSELNNWLTDQTPTNSGIVKYKYQSLSRRSVGIPSYFVGANTAIGDIYQRGYIYSVNSSGGYSASVGGIQTPEKFLVSAPFHFYFGLIKGETALDKFKIKYSVGE
jgi:hypothetical protein